MHVRKVTTDSYHPQINGETEHVKYTIAQLLPVMRSTSAKMTGTNTSRTSSSPTTTLSTKATGLAPIIVKHGWAGSLASLSPCSTTLVLADNKAWIVIKWSTATLLWTDSAVLTTLSASAVSRLHRRIPNFQRSEAFDFLCWQVGVGLQDRCYTNHPPGCSEKHRRPGAQGQAVSAVDGPFQDSCRWPHRRWWHPGWLSDGITPTIP